MSNLEPYIQEAAALAPSLSSTLEKQLDPTGEDYANPLEESSRWVLSARAYGIRSAASLAFSIANRQTPVAPSPTKIIWLDSTLSPEWKGKQKLRVEVWIPRKKIGLKRTAIINFHGGGFVLGNGTDDARWADSAMKDLDAVVFSVNYRLAPSYPFPTPVEDCADAILQISKRADEFGIDRDRIILTGFSAGGSLAPASWALLQDPKRWNYKLSSPVPNIAGMALFYPLLDWSISRPKKRQCSVKPELTLPKNLTDLFDASYVYPPIPREKRDDPRLSPGLMPDEMLERFPPLHLCLCEHDMLLAEGHTFAERLRGKDKPVEVRVVKEAKHAFDKPLPMAPIKEVQIEYDSAVQSIKGWLRK
ncbi:putative lipase 2 protein [Phaeoacremonium minimum UCRPA7]|uniref:Putative lipase 2 protein n=1 Tax=Phaeoacremonium minimum (strain UCR-PA7) TaxID=1286976 RepID=R8BB19_PHAM7|nr:putative lipase 2 protein [Phaeoacremonium minimum UCRPA7]EON96486.1 putative lipase 2 protein [Phaeoacremonium minimum UCRPA7]